MNKIILSALAAAAAVSVAAPAFATETVFDHSSDYVTQDIAAQGYDVTSVEEWGSYIVATIVDDQGHSSFKYFDPDTLALVR
jgi:hypothetical protein